VGVHPPGQVGGQENCRQHLAFPHIRLGGGTAFSRVQVQNVNGVQDGDNLAAKCPGVLVQHRHGEDQPLPGFHHLLIDRPVEHGKDHRQPDNDNQRAAVPEDDLQVLPGGGKNHSQQFHRFHPALLLEPEPADADAEENSGKHQ